MRQKLGTVIFFIATNVCHRFHALKKNHKPGVSKRIRHVTVIGQQTISLKCNGNVNYIQDYLVQSEFTHSSDTYDDASKQFTVASNFGVDLNQYPLMPPLHQGL